MSYDLYFWPSGATKNPRRLADRLSEEKIGALAADERVLAFRAELLRRWPDLADMIAPWHHDLGQRQPWGRTDLADRFVGVSLPFGWNATSALPVLAGAYGLDSYDTQSQRLMPAGTTSPDRSRLDAVTQLDGTVAEDHIVHLLRQVSGSIGYEYDELDEAALIGALDGTNNESAEGWFEYPLAGRPTLVVRLARSPGRGVVRVRVEGTMNVVLARQIETAMDLL